MFLNCLIGYVLECLKGMVSRLMFLRMVYIGYWGRYLFIWYGKFGVEKM